MIVEPLPFAVQGTWTWVLQTSQEECGYVQCWAMQAGTGCVASLQPLSSSA